jgi:molybdate transport system ATP-binding protein
MQLPAASGPGLEATLVKRLGQYTLELSLRCAPGATVILTGPSGSGKTTALRCLAGLERLDNGCIRFNGVCWDDDATGWHTHPRHRGIGFLSQDYALFPHMTLRQNIRFAQQRPGNPDKLLNEVGIGHLGDQRPHQVSGGERQRAALCQTLARRPGLLLLDEPFSALDAENRRLLRTMLRRAQAESQLAVVQVTHDLAEALSMPAEVVALCRGREDADWLERQRALLMADLDRLQASRPAHDLSAQTTLAR